MERVESSVIRAIEYREGTRELVIEFVKGATYLYEDVPPEIYIRLLNTASKGRYFNEEIRDAFEYTELD